MADSVKIIHEYAGLDKIQQKQNRKIFPGPQEAVEFHELLRKMKLSSYFLMNAYYNFYSQGELFVNFSKLDESEVLINKAMK
ncbi:MAG: hypothetical protein IPI04_02780 [Ignavibacteria bacterium]|nr:hypothetical protein [Ignavibacteria bacterium]